MKYGFDEIMVELKNDEEINSCFEEFKTKFKENPNKINKVKELLSFMDREESYPFWLFEITQNIFPKLFGEKGAKYLIHVLRSGIPNKEELDDELYTELMSLISQYGIQFVCAERFIENPMDYATSQLIISRESDLVYIRIIRADKSMFDLHIDLPTLARFTGHMLDKLVQAIEVKGELPEDVKLELFGYMYKFVKSSGDFNVEFGDENESGK